MLCRDYIRLAPHKLATFAKTIEKTDTERIDLIGFIDGAVRETCLPIPETMNQQVMYSGKIKYHGVNYQVMATPDWLIDCLFGPYAAQTNVHLHYLHSNLVNVFQHVV